MGWFKKEGEVYCGFFRGLSTSGFCTIDTVFGPGQSVEIGFYPFTKLDITERDGEKIKIWDNWFNLEDVIFNGEENKKYVILCRKKLTGLI